MTLTRIVAWSHLLAQEVLEPGDLAVDLTAGKGRDTCMLAAAVGPGGRVVAFDIQAEALTAARQNLVAAGCQVVDSAVDQPLSADGGVYLVHSCHTALERLVREPVKAAMVNLGYLPGGDQGVTTSAGSTVAALRQALCLLPKEGRLLVTVYPGHPGGAEEGMVVQQLFKGLSSADWQVLQVMVANHAEAPYLLAAEKKRDEMSQSSPSP